MVDVLLGRFFLLFIPKNNVYDVDYVDYVADVGHDSDRCVGF